MRTIRKCGGLDQYLLGDKPARIKELGLFGWRLRWRVMNSHLMRQKFQKERENLGLPPSMEWFKTFEEAWENDEELRMEVQKEQEKQWHELREKEKRFRNHVRTRWEPKDKKKYRSGRAVPDFDVESFNSLIPEKSS
jgi:large subunit ribosomal protein L28